MATHVGRRPRQVLSASSVKYILLFDVKIMYVVSFLCDNESLFMQNHLERIFSSSLVNAISKLKFL